MRNAGKSFTSSRINPILAKARPAVSANCLSATSLCLQPLATNAMPIFRAYLSTSSLSSPEMRPSRRPALAARDSPMTSSKENRFCSSPEELQQKVPSVRTPSTSITNASIAASRSESDTTKLFHDGAFALQQSFLAVAERSFHESHVPHESLHSVGL